MKPSDLDFETRAVHGGTAQAADFRPTAPAIYPSTTFVYDDVADVHAALGPQAQGFAYSRNANPTVFALETTLAALHETEDCVAFASGMAAIHAAILACPLQPGRTILAARHLYGGSRGLLSNLFAHLGFPSRFVDTGSPEAVEKDLRQGDVALLIFEPISNPLLTVSDVAALTRRAHEYGAMVIIDNTFASPCLLRPASLGVDLVVESATKYLGGHGDVVAGLVAGGAGLTGRVRELRTSAGAVLGPFEAWLVLRGVKTLPLRMSRHCANALTLAEWLTGREEVKTVHYPGLANDAGYTLSRSQFDGGAGGMVAFDTDFDLRQAEQFMNCLQLAVPGTSLGDVETLVLHPAQASHRSLSKEERLSLGIGDGLLRVSVGLESPADLFRDFETAFQAVYTPITHTVSAGAQ